MGRLNALKGFVELTDPGPRDVRVESSLWISLLLAVLDLCVGDCSRAMLVRGYGFRD